MNEKNIFYNSISDFYDEMINFDTLLQSRKDQLKRFIEKDFKTAIDIGCGSGVDSVALAMSGLNVTGYDPSGQMIKRAKANAESEMQNVTFVCGGISEVTSQNHKNIDLIISLGNTFANISFRELESSMITIYNIMKEGGKFLFQILNYEHPDFSKSNIININETESENIIRLNTVNDGNIYFHIIRFNKGDLKQNSILSTEIFPHKIEQLLDLLKDTGFGKIEVFGDLNMNEFDKIKSKNLVVSAEK